MLESNVGAMVEMSTFLPDELEYWSYKEPRQ